MFLIRNRSLITCRTYTKWLKRRAVRVLTSEESEEFHSARRKSPPANLSANAETETVRNTTLVSPMTHNIVKYETLQVGDPRFGPVITAAKSLTGRERRKNILLEGRRLITEAVQTSQPIQSIFFTDAEVLAGLPAKSLADSGVKFYKVKKAHMDLWSDTIASQGIMATCRLRNRSSSQEAKVKNDSLPLILLCDNIQDPGTLGTLIRSAVSACCRTLLVTKGCVDLWEPKVLRSGAGAHFHSQSLVTQLSWQQVGNYLSEDAELLLVSSPFPEVNSDGKMLVNTGKKHSKNESLSSARLSSVKLEMIKCGMTDTVLLVSGGLTTDACKFAASFNSKVISFPAVQGQDVMNVAVSGSVALFEVVRQLRLQAMHASDADSDTDVLPS